MENEKDSSILQCRDALHASLAPNPHNAPYISISTRCIMHIHSRTMHYAYRVTGILRISMQETHAMRLYHLPCTTIPGPRSAFRNERRTFFPACPVFALKSKNLDRCFTSLLFLPKPTMMRLSRLSRFFRELLRRH